MISLRPPVPNQSPWATAFGSSGKRNYCDLAYTPCRNPGNGLLSRSSLPSCVHLGVNKVRHSLPCVSLQVPEFHPGSHRHSVPVMVPFVSFVKVLGSDLLGHLCHLRDQFFVLNGENPSPVHGVVLVPSILQHSPIRGFPCGIAYTSRSGH